MPGTILQTWTKTKFRCNFCQKEISLIEQKTSSKAYSECLKTVIKRDALIENSILNEKAKSWAFHLKIVCNFKTLN